MGRRILTRWESLPPRRQVLWGIPVALVVLYLVHDLLFPRLSHQEAITYAVMECVPLALLLTWTTQNELRRRRAQEQSPPDASDPES
ncbi:MAG: hypothetical protein JWO69_146 [Thermoleophilia bacterium]|jgi:hypothetical protein|nr:hypothetical protein [Thermoleophilia bacterium]